MSQDPLDLIRLLYVPLSSVPFQNPLTRQCFGWFEEVLRGHLSWKHPGVLWFVELGFSVVLSPVERCLSLLEQGSAAVCILCQLSYLILSVIPGRQCLKSTLPSFLQQNFVASLRNPEDTIIYFNLMLNLVLNLSLAHLPEFLLLLETF